MSSFSVVVIGVRLYVNRLKGEEKSIYLLGFFAQLAYVFLMILQLISIAGGETTDLIHAIGPEVDILLVGYVLLITFYHSPRTWSEYIKALKEKRYINKEIKC